MHEELREEAQLFRLLVRLFYREPNRELLDEIALLNAPAADEADEEIGRGLALLTKAVQINTNRLENWQEELAIEYTRLFIGPKQIPAVPYASCYLSENRSLMTDETLAIRKKYLEDGLVVKKLYQMPDDHIAIELEYLYHLTDQALAAATAGKVAQAGALLQRRDDFMAHHLQKWAPAFAENVLAATGEDYFRGAACLLRGTVIGIATQTALAEE